MHIDHMVKTFGKYDKSDAIIWRNQTFGFDWLIKKIEFWSSWQAEKGIKPGTVVVLEGDFSPNSISLMLSLAEQSCIVVPIARGTKKKSEFVRVAQAEVLINVDEDDKVEFLLLEGIPKHPIYDILHERKSPGLVVFSSGSTGESKAIAHDFAKILEKFNVARRPFRTIGFLLFDHLGGINTVFHTLSNGGCIVTIQDRSPDSVLKLVDKYQAQLLPCTPTFLNLVVISESFSRFNLKSLSVITYGTEVMPESLLKRLREIFPNIELLQTYGLTETGVLRSKSKDSESLWVKIGGEGVESRVVDGLLELKSNWLMLGYLNAPSPFTEDGWFMTGDLVEQNGEYLKILGRKSEMINVGGEKVLPGEVESVIRELPQIKEVTVYGEKHAITGNIVCATVSASDNINTAELSKLIKQHCRKTLQPFKIPIKITYVDGVLYNERFKKVRFKQGESA